MRPCMVCVLARQSDGGPAARRSSTMCAGVVRSFNDVDSDKLVPLFADEGDVYGATEQVVELAIQYRAVELRELLLLQVLQARHNE